MSQRKYEQIKESRGWYYVEYTPLRNPKDKLAWLTLTITENANDARIAQAMESETRNWVKRYPVPVFVSAFDSKEDLYDLNKIREGKHLVGFFDKNNKIYLSWGRVSNEEIPDLTQEYLDNLYSNIPYETYEELAFKSKKNRQQIQLGWVIVFMWLTIVPIVMATLGYYNSLISLLAFLYSLYKAAEKALQLAGKWPKSKREKEKEKEERLKDHYYYHCQKNPKGFERLKIENFTREAEEKTAKEAALLKNFVKGK